MNPTKKEANDEIEPKVSKSEVGDRIRRLRESLKMSQSEFGEIMGLSKSSISRYEGGEFQNISVALLYGIAKLGGSLNKFFS